MEFCAWAILTWAFLGAAGSIWLVGQEIKAKQYGRDDIAFYLAKFALVLIVCGRVFGWW